MKNHKNSELNKLLTENKILKERIKELESSTNNIFDFVLGTKAKKLKELFMIAPIGVGIVEIHANIISANSYFCNMLGYSEEELKKLTIEDITYKEDYAKEEYLINQLPYNTSSSIKMEKRYYKKNGETVWASLVFIVFEDFNHKKYGLGFIEDITEKKQKDKALKESENRFKFIFNGINDSVFMHTLKPEGFNKFIEVNKIACTRYGYSRDEFLNLSPFDIISPTDEDIRLTNLFKKRLIARGRATVEIDHISKSGKILNVEVSSNIFTYKNDKVILSVVRDISKRKETEQKLKESKRRLSTLIGNLPGIAYHCQNDNFWTMDFISDAVYDITGHPVESLLNNKVISFNDIIIDEDRDRVHDIISEAINKKEKFDLEYRIITASGDIKWVHEQGCGIYLKDGNISHIEGYISDITEAKKRENELIKAKEKAEESDNLKSTFLATMSHELRTPLNGIIGFSELLDKTTAPEQVEVFSKNILDCGNSLLAIIEDIFDLALLETDTLTINTQTFKIFEIFLFNKNFLEDLLHKSGKQNEIELVYKPDNSIVDCFIESDRFKINQVLANLIKNAVKFTHEGSIEFGYYSENNSKLTFYIKDTGIGIAKEAQEVIFDFFRQAEEKNTRNYGGTGIGLTISRMIAKAMKGSLTVESEPGQGSTFYFSFPFNYSSEIHISKKREESKQTEQMDFSGKTFLIVEDEEINLFLLESILEKYNPKIITAENGLDAVIKYHENPEIDIILMDIKMPVMDGYEATEKIKEINKDIPIIALTAYNYDDDVAKINEAGFNSYIPKPFNKEDLISTIKEQLKSY